VSIFILTYVNSNLHVSTLHIIHKARNSESLKIVHLLASSTFNQCRLNAWAHLGSCRVPHEHRAHSKLYMLCTTCCLSTDFVGNTNTTNICLILSTIYIFIPVSGCVGRAPVHCFARGLIMLLRRPCI